MQTISIPKEEKQMKQNRVEEKQRLEKNDMKYVNDQKHFSQTQAETKCDNNCESNKKVYDHNHSSIVGIELRKENSTQTTVDESSLSLNEQKALTLKSTKQQCLQSIRLSYYVLGVDNDEKSPQKRLQKMKKSCIAIKEEQNCKPHMTVTKQSLKEPLKMDIKKLDFSSASSTANKKKTSTYYNQLSEELFLFNSGTKRWERSHMDIDDEKKELIVSSFHVPMMTIEKLKIFRPKKEENMREVKVTYEAGSEMASLFMNIKEEKAIKKLSINYVIFQEILTQKLANQNTYKQTKWTKQPHICQEVMFSSYIFGEIYKKSQYFGKWQKRYIVLNGEGVFSYRSAVRKEDCSFSIERKSIEYLWTRFDMIDNFLIIKVKHGMKQTQFGIPVTNYSNANFKNWLYYFYKLMETD